MVTHQAVVVYCDAEAIDIAAHQFFEVSVVLFLFKDDSLFDPSIDDMIIPCDLYAWFSWHLYPCLVSN